MNALATAAAQFLAQAPAQSCRLGLTLGLALFFMSQPYAGYAASPVEASTPAPAPRATTPEEKDTPKGFPLTRQSKSKQPVPATPLENGQRILLTPFIISTPLDERVAPSDPKAWEQRFLFSVQRAFQQQGFAVQVIMPNGPETVEPSTAETPASAAKNAAPLPPAGAAPKTSDAPAKAGKRVPQPEGTAVNAPGSDSAAALDPDAAPEETEAPSAPSLHNSVTGTVSGELHTITVYPLQLVTVADRERMSVKAQVSGTVTLFQETEKRAFLITKPVEGISNVNMKSSQNQGVQNSAAQRALEEALDNCAANLVRALREQ